MNILIIDDESNVCTEMERLIKDYIRKNNVECNISIRSFEHISWLLSYIDDGNTADIIFMDIKLKNYNGINLACKIQEINKKAVVIFMTGYTDYAEEIFKANPFHFLIKPVTGERLDSVMDKAIEHVKEISKNTFWFKIENVAHCLDKKDIYYIEAAGKSVNIHTKEKSYRVSISFKGVQQETENTLIKCHRSYLVNPEKVKRITRTEIELITGDIIPVSRAKSREICNKICMAVV